MIANMTAPRLEPCVCRGNAQYADKSPNVVVACVCVGMSATDVRRGNAKGPATGRNGWQTVKRDSDKLIIQNVDESDSEDERMGVWC